MSAKWVCGGWHRATWEGTGPPALQAELDPAARSRRLQAPGATCGGCAVQDFTATAAGVHPRFAILLQQAWAETPSPARAASMPPWGHPCWATPPGLNPGSPSHRIPCWTRGLQQHAAVQEPVQQLQVHAQLLQNLKPASSRLEGTRCCRGPGTPSHCLHRGFLFTSQSSKQTGLRWLWLLRVCLI